MGRLLLKVSPDPSPFGIIHVYAGCGSGSYSTVADGRGQRNCLRIELHQNLGDKAVQRASSQLGQGRGTAEWDRRVPRGTGHGIARWVKDKARQAKDKARQVKDKAGQGKDKSGQVKDKAGQAKDKARQVKYKTGQVKDIVKSKASEAKNKAEEKAGETKYVAQDKMSQSNKGNPSRLRNRQV
ncbi:hypothetical protein PsorP6_006758 [Peronosclerospora sorghi]|uniref:Uncharacterized protein n=1 Tax=Peronosclerospora sorghi TaxID=230839 RepID=A0ACC0W3Y9_9STRA|nr:hypothetical protein PsorP6_006758 [Peronosclerospora sorghi]